MLLEGRNASEEVDIYGYVDYHNEEQQIDKQGKLYVPYLSFSWSGHPDVSPIGIQITI